MSNGLSNEAYCESGLLQVSVHLSDVSICETADTATQALGNPSDRAPPRTAEGYQLDPIQPLSIPADSGSNGLWRSRAVRPGSARGCRADVLPNWPRGFDPRHPLSSSPVCRRRTVRCSSARTRWVARCEVVLALGAINPARSEHARTVHLGTTLNWG